MDSSSHQTNSVEVFVGNRNQPGFKDGHGQEAQFFSPNGIVVNPKGGLFISDAKNHCIRSVDRDGNVTIIAGDQTEGGKDGVALSASFSFPTGLCIHQGNLLIADQQDNKIRMLDQEGNVRNFAGTGEKGYQEGHRASGAVFNSPTAVCCYQKDLLVADQGNNRIRLINEHGMVSSFAGTGSQGSDDGPVNSASFRSPTSIVVSSDQRIFVSDSLNHCIRMIYQGMVSTFAGCGSSGYKDGVGEAAMFHRPSGLAITTDDAIFVADDWNHRIILITSDSNVSTIAGTGSIGFEGGSALQAKFNNPVAVCVSQEGDLYVCDSNNHCIRMIKGVAKIKKLAASTKVEKQNKKEKEKCVIS